MSLEKIIFAFDFTPDGPLESVLKKKLVPFSKMLESVGMVKIGMELFYSTQGEILSNFDPDKVFLDLKLNDIPATVGPATKAICKKYRPKFLSVHLSEKNSFQCAVEAAEPFGTKIIGITVLTSMTEGMCLDTFGKKPYDQVEHFVTSIDIPENLGGFVYENFGGFVCSGHEVEMVRNYWPSATIIVPGVRSKGTSKNDQRRVVTPGEAIKSGANYVVIGRQIRDAEDPFEEAKRISDEIAEAIHVQS